MTHMPNADRLTAFLLVRARPEWLSLSRADRRALGAAAMPVEPHVRFRQFDCEAFSAMCSDIWMLTVPSPRSLNAVIERLRDKPLFAKPYFDLVAILPAIEDGWKQYEGALDHHG
jgi:hypothetical protein